MKIASTFTARTILSNFGSWIVYGLVSATGHPGWAYIGGLLVCLCQMALCQMAAHWRTPPPTPKRLKIMDGVTLLFFLAGAISTQIFHSSFFPRSGSILIWVALAVVAWGSLLARAPFTAEYARESVPETVWASSGFRRVNVIITAAWGTVFVLNAFLSAIIRAIIGQDGGSKAGYKLIWLQILIYVLTAVGIDFTNRYPQWVSRQWASDVPPEANT